VAEYMELLFSSGRLTMLNHTYLWKMTYTTWIECWTLHWYSLIQYIASFLVWKICGRPLSWHNTGYYNSENIF